MILLLILRSGLMIRDENWFDAVGKDDWRVEQIEKREEERKKANEIPQTHAVPTMREQGQSG